MVGASTRPSSARRAGFVIAALVDAGLLIVINVIPGWESLSFVTAAAVDVIWWVNLALLVGLVANVVYVFADAYQVRALGDVAIAVVGLIAAVQLLQVFPFDFAGTGFPWAVVVRMVLWAAVLGSVVSLVVNVGRLFRGPPIERY